MHHADGTLKQNDFASQPCRDAPADQGHNPPGNRCLSPAASRTVRCYGISPYRTTLIWMHPKHGNTAESNMAGYQ